MGVQANFYLWIVALLWSGTAIAGPVQVADVCTCEAVIDCADGDQVNLSVRNRKSQCEKFLGQELQKVKDSDVPYCADKKYPDKLAAFTTKDCEKANIELWHCRDGKEGSRICDTFRKLYDYDPTSPTVRLHLDQLSRELNKVRASAESTLKAFNEPMPIAPPPVTLAVPLTADELPGADDGLPKPTPIVDEEERTPLPVATPVRHFLDLDIGAKARWLADEYCNRRKVNHKTAAIEDMVRLIKKISRDLAFFQETAQIYPISNCEFEKAEDIKSLRDR